MMQVRRLGLWVVLLALLAFTVYGAWEAKLFKQYIWSHVGLQRFLIFAAAYALFFAVFSLWKPGLFPVVIGVGVLAFTVAAAGPIALLAVILVFLSSLVLGEWMLPSNSDSWLAMLLGLSVYMFAVSIAALVPVNYPAVYLAALVAPLLARPRAAWAWLARIPSLRKPLRLTRPEQLASGALIFVLLLHWLAALELEVGPDALSMHLVVPSSLAMFHLWTFDVTRQLWAVMPKGASWCFALCYLLGGEAAARLFNLALLVCIVALLLRTIRKWLPPAPALLIAALFAATPLVQLVTGSLFVENLWALLCFGAFVSLGLYRENGREPYLYLAWLLLGAGAATKAIALAFLPPFGLISLWTLAAKRKPSANPVRAGALALACYVIFAAPPYLTAYAKTGNPVFPYLARIFPSRFASLEAAFPGPPSPPHLGLRTFYDLTFHTSLFREVQDGAIGFQYFVFLPLGILLLRRKGSYPAISSGLTLLVFSAITFIADPGVRYLFPALPLATVFIASTFAALRGDYPRLYPVAMTLAVALLCLNLYFLPSSNWLFKDFVSNPLSESARQEYVTAHAPERNLVAYLNKAHPGVPVAFLETNAIAGLRASAVTTTWHNIEFYDRMLAAKTPPDCLRIVEDFGARMVIAPSPGSGALIKTTPIEGFLRHCTDPELRSGNFYAGRVQDQCSAGWDQPGPAVPPGEYDDLDDRVLYKGLWVRGQFAEAAHGTLTYSNAAGAALVFRFTGQEARYVYTKAFNRGIAEIILDGASQGTLDLYSPAIAWKSSTPIRATGPGEHTLEIRVTGRKNPAARDAHVDLDDLIVQ